MSAVTWLLMPVTSSYYLLSGIFEFHMNSFFNSSCVLRSCFIYRLSVFIYRLSIYKYVDRKINQLSDPHFKGNQKSELLDGNSHKTSQNFCDEHLEHFEHVKMLFNSLIFSYLNVYK